VKHSAKRKIEHPMNWGRVRLSFLKEKKRGGGVRTRRGQETHDLMILKRGDAKEGKKKVRVRQLGDSSERGKSGPAIKTS